MKSALLFAVSLMTACGVSPMDPSAQNKHDLLIDRTRAVVLGSEFQIIDADLGFNCDRKLCDSACLLEYLPRDAALDELLICRWDESPPDVSFATFGTVLSVSYLREDRIIKQSIEVVYTGP